MTTFMKREESSSVHEIVKQINSCWFSLRLFAAVLNCANNR